MPDDLFCRDPVEIRTTPSQKTILLVDEDPGIGVAFDDFFNSEKYRMIQASTVTDALDHLRQEKIDLIITDLRLSQYSGLSLLVRLRTLPYRVPVIVMSAFTDFMSEEDWKQLGAAEFISKPPDLTRLREVISRVLRKSSEKIHQ